MEARERIRGTFGALVGMLVCALVALPASASAQTFDVHPGKRAIQRAVNRAGNGDTLRIHDGRYVGQVTIEKRLSLIGVGGRPKIDGNCNTPRRPGYYAAATVSIGHSGVVLKHLKVMGGQASPFPSEIDFEGVAHGEVRDVWVGDSCDAEYGVNVFQSGDIKVVNIRASGFEDAGVYIGGIVNTAGGFLDVRTSTLFNNARGVIIEDTPNTAAVDVRIRSNLLQDNTTVSSEGPPDGLFLHNTDGILISGNSASANAMYGFHADANSNDNVFTSNTASGNGSPPSDANAYHSDNVTGGDCGTGNVPANFGLPATRPLSCP